LSTALAAVLPRAGSAGWVWRGWPCRLGVLRQHPGQRVLPGGSAAGGGVQPRAAR